jgi:hypothetical protein
MLKREVIKAGKCKSCHQEREIEHFGVTMYRSVNKFFKTLAKLASSSVFSLDEAENNYLKM